MYHPACKSSQLWLNGQFWRFRDVIIYCESMLSLHIETTNSVTLYTYIRTLQVAFGLDFTQTWDDKSLGLKRAKGTGKMTFLIAHSSKGMEQSIRSAIPSLYPVSGISYQRKIFIYRLAYYWSESERAQRRRVCSKFWINLQCKHTQNESCKSITAQLGASYRYTSNWTCWKLKLPPQWQKQGKRPHMDLESIVTWTDLFNIYNNGG